MDSPLSPKGPIRAGDTAANQSQRPPPAGLRPLGGSSFRHLGAGERDPGIPLPYLLFLAPPLLDAERAALPLGYVRRARVWRSPVGEGSAGTYGNAQVQRRPPAAPGRSERHPADCAGNAFLIAYHLDPKGCSRVAQVRKAGAALMAPACLRRKKWRSGGMTTGVAFP